MSNYTDRVQVLALGRSKVLVRSYERILKSVTDFDLEVEDSVRSALRVMMYYKPDVIISEWELSDMTVIELLTVLNRKEELKVIPVIICTDSSHRREAADAEALGAKEILFTPINDDKLKRALISVIPSMANINPNNEKGNLPETRRQSIIAELNRIQQTASLPAIVPRILQVSNDPNSSAKHLGEVIKQDQSLTAKILRIVNSAFYGLYRKVGNIDHAIVILGFNEIRNISTAACLIKAHKGKQSRFFDQSEFWLHSLSTAYISRALSDLKQDMNTEDAFVTGLLHDYGKVIMSQFLSDYFTEIIEIAHEKNMPIQNVAQQYLKIDHAQIGGLVSENWKLPVKLVKAVAFHHKPLAAQHYEYDIHLAHISNYFAHKFGIGNSGNPVHDELNEESMQIFGFQDTEHEMIWERLNIDLEKIQEFISISAS